MFNRLNFSEAINWWVTGLLYLCPATLRNTFVSPDRTITIEFNDNKSSIKSFVSGIEQADKQLQFNSSESNDKQNAIAWLKEQKTEEVSIVLIIPDENILIKKMSFPKAAGSNLRQILSFEMNRKTPFSPEQVYYDFLLPEVADKEDKIHPELFLVPRERINSNIELLKNAGVVIDAIRPEKHKHNKKINLIAPEDRPNKKSNTDKTLLFLTCTTCLLLIAILYTPITVQKKELSTLESAIAKNRKAAIQLQELKSNKALILKQSQFLENKRRNEISSINLINEVTKIIPEDTWLNRFVMKAGEIKLQGESSNASSLIQILESSSYFTKAQFRSPITQNVKSQKDKFHLSASYVRDKI